MSQPRPQTGPPVAQAPHLPPAPTPGHPRPAGQSGPVHPPQDRQRFGVATLDLFGMLTGWDRTAAQLYRSRAGEVLGRRFADLWPAMAEQDALPLDRLAPRGPLHRHQFTGWGRRGDGVRFWAQALVTTVRDQAGAVVSYAAVVNDLAPDSLTAEVGSILEALPEAVLAVDAAGTVVLSNRAAEALFGYDRAELLGCPVEILVPAHLRPVHRLYRGTSADRADGGPAGPDAQTGLRRDGTTFAADIALSTTVTSNGPVTAAVVRERVAGADRRERRTDARFGLAFDQAPTGMALIGPAAPTSQGTGAAARVLRANPALCRMLGRSESELQHGDPLDLIGEQDRPLALARVIALRDGAIPAFTGVRISHRRPDGRELWLSADAWPVRAAGGAPAAYMVQVVDDTAARADELDRDRRNARDQHIATVLQQSLLPSVPHTIGPVAVAARYEAAGVGAAVGGDWHDAFPLPGGRVGFAVGDVAGHGVESAATMARLRQALRVLACDGERPSAVLAGLNRLMVDDDRISVDIELATVFYGELDPATGALVCASAGHLPLLVLPGPRRARGSGPAAGPWLASPAVNVPLGVLPEVTFSESRFTLPASSLLVGYTDGLVERRGVLLHEALDALVRGVGPLTRALVGDPETVADALLATLPEAAARDDDTALLVLALPDRFVGQKGRRRSTGRGRTDSTVANARIGAPG